METILEVGKTYTRTNINKEKLSDATITPETLEYHIDLLKSGICYEEKGE